MKKKTHGKKARALRTKLTSLILAAAVLVTSSFVAIALDTYSAADNAAQYAMEQLTEQTFTLTPEDGVTVTLNGKMPEFGHAEAKPADVSGKDVLHAYDITIFYGNGSEFEPADGETIAVSFQSDDIKKAVAKDGDSLTVGHIDDSGRETEVPLAYAKGDEAGFNADSFSIYVIYEHENDGDLREPLKTFYFLSDHFTDYGADGSEIHGESASGLYESGLYKFPNTAGEMVSTQVVKDGEKLHSIVMPDNSEYGSFHGWYIVDLDFEKSVLATIAHSNGAIAEGTELTAEQLTHFVYSWGDNPQRIDADTVIEVGDEDENVYLAPLYYNFRFVEFLGPDDGSGRQDVATRKIFAMGTNHVATVSISDVVAESAHLQELFYGWSYKNHIYQTRLSTGEEIEQTLTLTDDDFPDESDTVKVYPVYKQTDYIEFDVQANDATPVSAMLSFLYDPNVAEQERATVSQLPSATRPGYIFDGWYARYTDENDQVVEQQVSMAKHSPTDTTNSAIITDGNHIRLDTDPDGSYLYSGKLYLRHGMTLYAHWRAVNTADYKVVIWKQKVTDDKNATDANKHYDYYDYTLMEGAASGSVILDLASYQAKGFENLANSGNPNFDCFHYNRTEVVVDGVAYDGSTQREQGVVAPNGSTVVNVYYDRNLMTIRFDYGNNYTADPNGDYIRVSSNYYSIGDYRSIIESNGQISYLSSSNGGAPYNGTIYYKSDNSYYQLTGDPDRETTYYYKSGSKYYSLRWNDYTGTRYKKNDVIFTGLYEQTFAQNGYQWSDVSDVKWLDGSTTQTLLDGFVDKRNPYVLTANGASGTSIIYHYKQGLDGKYSIDDRVIAYGSGGTSFKFTNKFRGFTVSSYKTGSNGFNQNGGTSVSVDQSASVSYPLHVYHSRNSFKLTFANYRTESNSGGQPNDWVFNNVPYEKPLSEIIAENPSLMTPPARDNYDFEGWYLDAGCTKEADFSEEFMPAANMIVYAKWDLKHYMVEIDPDGGEMQAGNVFSAYTDASGDGTEITYTRVQYGDSVQQPQNMIRNYVPAQNGDYVYVNIRLAPTIEEAAENWTNRVPAEYRSSFYCRRTDLDTVYNTYFAGLESNGHQLLPQEDFLEYCVNNTQFYRKLSSDDSNENYAFEGWYKVNADGTTSSEAYHFGDPVTQDTRVRAVWKRNGAYYLEYDPYDSRYHIGRDVMVDDHQMHNATLYDPCDPYNPPETGATRYHDHAQAVVLQHPTYIPAHYIFRGWQLLTASGEETDQYYAPGDAFVVDSAYADNRGIIHFEAAYEPESESVRVVDVAGLILDANKPMGGYAVKGDLDIYENPVYVDLDADQVKFEDQANNFKVHLKDYYDNFRNEEGYMLIGWNRTPDPGNYVPEFAADAVIGIDTNDNELNILYAVWEPMYYLTLENHSTEYNITFNLKFTGYDDVVYSGNSNTVLSEFVREVFSEHTDENNNIIVVKKGTADFDVTVKKAESSQTPTSIKLVLPQGLNVKYTVSGSIENAKKDDNTVFVNDRSNMFSVYNSGGPSEQLTCRNTGSSYRPNYKWFNLSNQQTNNYSVSGNMKLGSEGQVVAFYTGNVDTVDIIIQGLYYDLAQSTWLSATDGAGPNATLWFEDISELDYSQMSGTNGINGISIIKNTANTFSVNESFTNTNYKFIGWYETNTAAPGDVTLDGRTGQAADGSYGAAKVEDIPVPNTSPKYYFALYVPKADGNLVISHDEKDSSIGYPKYMSVAAQYGTNTAVTDDETTNITSIADRTDKVHTSVSIPVSETDAADTPITITLGVRSGYGSIHNDTYEGTTKLEGEAVRDDSAGVWQVHEDPNDASTDYEEKYLWVRTVSKTLGDVLENSETIKGLKVVNPLNYYTDFARKYEFVYNYVFRDGVTPRKYLVTGTTAEYRTMDDFRHLVTESAPYVSNFGENLSWNTASIRVTNLDGKGKIIAEMDAAQFKNAKANVYVHSYGTSVTETWSINIGNAFDENNRPTAPLIIENSDGSRVQFYRWKITETEKGSNGEAKFVGYCYYNEFTFMVWDDYDITPEYVEMTGDEYHRYYPDDEQTAYANIDFLKNTRNQWVDLEDDNVTIKYDENGNATYNDALISDYSIIFIDHGKRINTNPGDYKVGLLYEVVGEVDDEGVTVTDSDYTETTESYRENIINIILNNSKQNGSVKAGGKTKFYYSKMDPTTLTHDNRIEFYRGIDNLRTSGELNPNAKYIFNVYAYMKLSDGTMVQSDSVRLQMFDLATRTNISG